MIRMNPIFAASAIAALLALGAGAASAATTNYNAHPSPAPAPAPASGPNGSQTPRWGYCSVRADQMGIAGPAWEAFVVRCQKTGGL
jgi:hypothetical protein